MVAKIAEANNVLSRRLKRLPTHNEIAEMLNIHISTVRLAFERTRYPISLDGGVTDRGCMTLQVSLFYDKFIICASLSKHNLFSSLYVAEYHSRARWNKARKNGTRTANEARVEGASEDTKRQRSTYIEITFWPKWKYPEVLWGNRNDFEAVEGESSTA